MTPPAADDWKRIQDAERKCERLRRAGNELVEVLKSLGFTDAKTESVIAEKLSAWASEGGGK